MFSLIQPALLSEVSFCVLDKSGRVLFHSDEKRNLRENFISEIGNDRLIREVIANHIDTTLQVSYYGDIHAAHFKPVETLPYTIVVMYNTSFFMETLSNQATFTLLMLIALGLLLTLVIIISYFLTSPQNVLRRQRLGIKWLYFSPSNRTGFVNLFFWLWLPAGLSMLFMRRENVVFLSFFLPVFTLALSGGVIYQANKDGYKRGFYSDYVLRQYRIFLAICAGVGIIFLAALLMSDVAVSFVAAVVFILAEAVMIALVVKPALLPIINVEARWKSVVEKNPARQVLGKYIAVPACFLLLLNFSFFPACNFFITSVRQEREIKQKRNSLELAEGIERREHWLLSKFSGLPSFDLLRKGIYMPGGQRAVDSLKFRKPKAVHPGGKLNTDDSGSKRNTIKPVGKRNSMDSVRKRNATDSVGKRDAFLALYNRIVNLPNITYSDRELQTSFRDLNYGVSAGGRWKWRSPSNLEFFTGMML